MDRTQNLANYKKALQYSLQYGHLGLPRPEVTMNLGIISTSMYSTLYSTSGFCPALMVSAMVGKLAWSEPLDLYHLRQYCI